MKLLVSTSHGIWIVSVEDKKLTCVLEGVDRKYYGLSWDSENVYVARMIESKTDLLVYDKQFHEKSCTFVKDLADAHQIHYWNRRLYMTNTRFNRLTISENNTFREYGWAPTGRDVNHVNSLWVDTDGMFYCIEHNRYINPIRRSRVRIFRNNWTPVADYQFGRGMHNVVKVDADHLVCCSSNDFSLVKYNMRIKEIVLECDIGGDNFLGYELWLTRGMAYNGNTFFVGMSEYAKRDRRLFTSKGAIAVIDNSFRIKDRIEMPNCGQIYEVRLMDGTDIAHNRIPF